MAISRDEPPEGRDALMPIAIVGIACRFPGEASSPERLWDMISHGRSARVENVPASRFNIDAFYHPSGERRGNTNVRGGHFIEEDVGLFDAPFFGITAQEAHAMDPQQRLALEMAYEALENAGIRLEQVSGTSMACYMASFTADWAAMNASEIDDYPRYFANGHYSSMLSNRVSWFLNIHGPSVSMDTACSSSLVALHMACQSLRAGDSPSALVGATNLILLPHAYTEMSSLHFLGPDAKSMAFDHKANGYARGEGVAMVVLKPLAKAIEDGDVIRAVIRGTAVNHDGRTPGINLPSAASQEALIKATYAAAGLDTRQTGYFEAHGTGTPAGDPLEASAIAAAVGKFRDATNPLVVGSIKTNIGHLEGSAGLAGVIKAVYALEKGQIPPNVWFEKANPAIPLSQWGLRVPTDLVPWPTTGLRRASVNSFGYGGTNAHCILDDAYHYLRQRGMSGHHNTVVTTVPDSKTRGESSSGTNGVGVTNGVNGIHPVNGANGVNVTHDVNGANGINGANHVNGTDGINGTESVHGTKGLDVANGTNGVNTGDLHSDAPKLLVWSSQEQAGVSKLRDSLGTYISQWETMAPPDSLDCLAHTLSTRRTKLAWTSYAVVSAPSEAPAALQLAAAAKRIPAHAPGLVFVFTGQGAQWYGMGRELLAYAAYRKSIEDAYAYLRELGAEWNLVEELQRPEEDSRVNQSHISQPACTALQVALVDLLDAWGVRPSMVVGHSSGEIAAAYAQGAIGRESAWNIAYHRGRLSASLARGGAMLAVALGEEAVKPYLAKMSSYQLSIACINSPNSVTLSGDETSIAKVQSILRGKVVARRLFVKTAYHSPAMREISQPYIDSLNGLRAGQRPTRNNVVMFSSVLGEEIGDHRLQSAEYWSDNMVSPVKFKHALDAALARVEELGTPHMIVEIGPHGALQGPIRQILGTLPRSLEVPSMSLLTRKQDAVRTTMEAMGLLFQHGVPVAVNLVNSPRGTVERRSHLVDLPPFPWVHGTRYWSEPNSSRALRSRKEPRHDLLGSPCLRASEQEPSWRNHLRLSEVPWLQQHKVQDSILFPFAGMLAMVVEAARQIADPVREMCGVHLRDVSAGTAMILSESEDEPTETLFQTRPWRSGTRSFDSAWFEFTLSSRSRQGIWTSHSTGLFSLEYAPTGNHEVFFDEKAAASAAYRDEYQRAKASQDLQSQDIGQFYEFFARMGNDWGPAFRGLADLQVGDSLAVGTVAIPATQSMMPESTESRYLIHPAALDSIFHIAVASGGIKLDRPRVPKFVENIYLSVKLPTGEGQKLYGCARKTAEFFSEVIGSIRMSDEAWDEPLVIIDGFKYVQLDGDGDGQQERPTTTASLAKLASSSLWALDVENSPGVVSATIQRTCDRHSHPTDETVKDLELAAYIICKKVMRRFTPEDAEHFTPHHRYFYKYIERQCMLASKGELLCYTPEWDTLDAAAEDALLARVATETLDGELVCRAGDNIESIFLGLADPLEVLREGGLLDEFYRNALFLDRSFAGAGEYIRLLSHKRPLRILEVGAGTGGATHHVMRTFKNRFDVLSRIDTYTYTDITSGFFETASERFAEWSSIFEYKVLDIEKDPSSQGFEPGSYDLVVAFQVLHATSSIRNSLEHCKMMLKPGGKILLIEITGSLARTPMAFGVLPGWWNGENDGRQYGPGLTEQKWESHLRDLGFSGLDFCIHEGKDGLHNASLFVSTLTAPPALDLPRPRYLVVVPDGADEIATTFGVQLQSQLAAGGALVQYASLSGIASLDLGATTCIVLDFGSCLASIDDASLDCIKRIFLKSYAALWVTRGAVMDTQHPDGGLVAGLARTAHTEREEARLVTLDLDPTQDQDPRRDLPASIQAANTVVRVLQLFDRPGTLENELAERDGQLYVSRIYPDEDLSKLLSVDEQQEDRLQAQSMVQADRPLKLKLKTPGMLDTFWFDDDGDHSSGPLSDDQVEVRVKAVGLNMHDLATVMGQIWEENLGVEYSGVVTRVGSAVTKFAPGDRVVSCGSGWYRTYIRDIEQRFVRIPDDLTFEDGATMVVSYITAVYGILYAGRLEKGESILIHAAAGALGRTAIELAQHIGAEVFVTVSSEAKKQFLMESYGIPEDHVFSNQDLSFAKGVKRLTKGRGVDVILNTMVGEGLRKTWHCIAPLGRFVELGLRDIEGNTGLDMSPFAANTSYHGVNVLVICQQSPRLFNKLINDVMRLYSEGTIKVVRPIQSFKFSDISEAFLAMQTRKRVGKVVLRVDDGDIVQVTPPRKAAYRLRSDASYFLPGGLGGLGRAVAKWMAEHGARHLVFTSRSGAQDPRAQQLLKDLEAQGVKTMIFQCDIGDEHELIRVLGEVRSAAFPEIRGTITFAMQLQDILISDMKAQDYWAAVRPKYQITRNMHNHLPKDLDFFICLSSYAGVQGSRGQGNYNAGNTYQDAIARYRRALGLKGTSIDLGIVAEIGFVAENADRLGHLKMNGPTEISQEQLFAVIQAAMAGELESDPTIGLSTGGMIKAGRHVEPQFFSDPRFGPISVHDTQDRGAGAASSTKRYHLATLLGTVASMAEATAVICEALVAKLAKGLMAEAADLDPARPANTYGVDSLVALEIRAWVRREVRSDVSVFEILSNMPITDLASSLAAKSMLVPEEFKDRKEDD